MLIHDPAKNGFPVSRSLSDWSHTDVPILSQFPLSAKTFLPNGEPPKDGDKLTLPDLARSFERLAELGARKGFYEGETARIMSESLAVARSPLRAQDFANDRAECAAQRRALIDPKQAAVMGEVPAGIPHVAATPMKAANGDTCYFCAVDEDGLAVSIIESIYHDFGSGFIAGDSGILMQNRGSFFSLDETSVNRLEPGKKTFHTLIPAMLFKDGVPYLVYGSMGGEGQPQTHAAIVSRIVDFGYDVQQAIESPRWLMGRT